MRSPTDLRPVYPYRPIRSVKSLARDLGVPVDHLLRLAHKAPKLYRPVPQLKADGSTRWTYDAKPPLKRVQGLIKDRLLLRVAYPGYLQGSIRDPDMPRDPLTNANAHAGNRIFIQEDVKGFFGSISPSVVHGIWRGVFGFPSEVADLLTVLTTYDGITPEGARTSSYIANLALWDVEPDIFRALHSQGLVYTRYVDDITISASRNIPAQEKTNVIGLVYGMLAAKGCNPNRTKHAIHKKGQISAPGKGVIVTGYAVSGGRPSVSKSERSRVRSAVRQIELQARSDGTNPDLQALFRSTASRVARIARCGSAQGHWLRQRLAEVNPSVFPKRGRLTM